MDPRTESRLLRLAIAQGLLSWEDLDTIADQAVEDGPEDEDGTGPGGRWIPALVAAGRLTREQVAALARDVAQGLTTDIDERQPPEAAAFAPEFRFLNDWQRYRVERFLGAGGMGTVYKAFDPSLDRYVALKFLHRNDAELTERFLREARAQARVDHPNVCQVHEVGEVAGRPYIAMQYIEGKSLAELGPALSMEHKVALVRDVARAVHSAHRTGLVHRDLKPGNVLVARHDSGAPHPYVVDFGLAQDEGERGLTRTGMISGTPAYISPEQAQGMPLDQRTDVYSLGIVLYELLSGAPPFTGANLAKVLVRLVQEDPKPLSQVAPHVPEDLQTIVAKCLEKDPGRRYLSAWALAEDLDRFLQGEPIHARPSGWLYRTGKRLRKNRALATVSAAAVLALVVLGGFSLRAQWEARERTELAQRFGQRIGEMETAMRYAARLPLHDMTPEKDKLRRELAEIRAEIGRLGPLAVGPGHAALGTGHLALGQYEEALEHLEKGWAAGERTPEVAAALGETLGVLYERSLAEANRSPGGEAGRAAAREEVERTYGRSALNYLREGFGEEVGKLPYIQALIAFYERRFPEAAAQARRAFAENRELYKAAQLEAQVYTQQADEAESAGRYDEAFALYDRAGTIYRDLLLRLPSDASLHAADCDRRTRRISAALLTGSPGEDEIAATRAACDRALTVDPELAEALTQKSRLAWRIGTLRNRRGEDPSAELAQAVELAQRAIALNPRDAGAYSNLATANRELADWQMGRGIEPGPAIQRAIAAARTTVALQPGLANAHSNLGTTYLQLARGQQRRGVDPQRALELAAGSLEQATTLNPRFLPAYLNLGNAWKTKAEAQIAKGLDPSAALAQSARALETAVELNPSSAAQHNFLGNVHLTLGEYLFARGADLTAALERAVASYGRAIAVKPDYAFAHYNLGYTHRLRAEALLARGEDPGPALAAAGPALAESLRLNPNDADVFLEKARVDLVAGRWSARQGRDPEPAFRRAEGELRQAAGLNPEQPDISFTRAQVERYRAERLPARAAGAALREGLDALSGALAINPREGRYLALRGTLLLAASRLETDPARRRGQQAEGAAAIREAIAINPLLAKEYGPLLGPARHQARQ